MTSNLTRQLVIRVDPELLKALEHDAKANGRTVSQTVRHHLRKALR